MVTRVWWSVYIVVLWRQAVYVEWGNAVFNSGYRKNHIKEVSGGLFSRYLSLGNVSNIEQAPLRQDCGVLKLLCAKCWM